MIPASHRMKKGLRHPLKATAYLAHRAYKNASVSITSRRPFGTNLMTLDWDVCIILDACRVDALRTVSTEFSFLSSIDRRWSVGGSTPEWLVHTFDAAHREALSNTAYLTANAWAERILGHGPGRIPDRPEFIIVERLRRFGDWNLVRPEALGRFENVWRHVPETDQVGIEEDPDRLMPGGAPPRYLTDRAIAVGRTHDFGRMLIHYIQPHAPYSARARTEDRDPYEYERRPFDYLRETSDRTSVYEAYLDELRYVLEDVELLLENLEAETVVISADHGEAFGEFRAYMHDSGSINPYVRFVPWVRVEASDSGTYEPQNRYTERDDSSVETTLQALGYRS